MTTTRRRAWLQPAPPGERSLLVTRTGAPEGRAEATPYVVLFALMLLFSQSAFACSVCHGAPGDPLVKGANNGIMFLLGIVGFVQIGFVAMFWSFWRRAREQKRFRESLKVIEGGARS